ncbi:MAG: tetratricopeptide repeat protein [Pseudomonadota bacterium]
MAEESPIKFLLVDQDVNRRKIQNAFLREMGYQEIFQARGGTEAWSILKNYEANFVIAFWELPDMSGVSLLKILRADAASAHIPYLLVVESVTKSQVLEAGEAGVTDIITSPATKNAFKKKIWQTVARQEQPTDLEFKKRYAKGLDLMKQGRFEEALEEFKAMLSIYENAEIYYNVGYIKTAQGKYEEAIMAFQRAAQIDKAHAAAYKKMGEVYIKLGRVDEARTSLERAAEIFMEKSMDLDAEEVLLEALKLNPKTLNIFNSLGIIYRRRGDFEEAIKNYRRALKVDPQDENIHYNLARVYLSLGLYTEAYKVLVRALALNPGFQEARTMLDSLNPGSGSE